MGDYSQAHREALEAASKETHFAKHAEAAVETYLSVMLSHNFVLSHSTGEASRMKSLEAENARLKEALEWERRSSDLDFMEGKK